ncbi:MAG TPA: choice-of-anchor I family protein [Chitinophagales bacterium]|nr:choice-of-anchor I family protein [Chitinophagales bacterium]HRK27856.1 choice-of-anchor I family protein [Chitinophagales bacterium]
MKKLLAITVLWLLCLNMYAQTTLAFWDFNSNPSDANTGTGTLLAATGSGTLSLVGTTTSSGFNAGHPDDPNSGDNSGWQTTGYPTQSTAPKTSGIQIAVSTVGYSGIKIDFKQRLSNTAANTWVLQYSLDVTATTPVWTDAQTYTFTPAASGTGDTWYSRSYDFSAITGLNNNANAAFRVVSDFGNATQYLAARSTSTYGTTGTSRFDLIHITDTPPAVPYTLQFEKADQTVSEAAGTVQVNLRVATVGNVAGSINLLIASYSTAANPADYIIIGSTTISVPTSLALNNLIPVTFFINDDALDEADEFIICKLGNAANVNFAPTAQHTLYIRDNDRNLPQPTDQVALSLLASFNNGAPANNSAEICAHDPNTQRLFIANSVGSKLDIINFANPASPVLINSIDITPYGAINSVAVKNGIVALAIEDGINKQNPGKVVFVNTNGDFISQVSVGAMPDMVVFNHAGTRVLTANEGEPNDTYTHDPEGSVSVIDISGGVTTVTNANVTNIGFTSYNGQEALLRSQGIRIYGPGASAAQDFEPEYITISDNDTRAWVTLQENNALVEIDLTNNTIVKLIPLGYKDHNLLSNGIDASDVTSDVNISNFPIKGMYLPDAMASFTIAGNQYLITANEGDARAYTGFNEETTIGAGSYVLDPAVFPNAADIKNNFVLGRLKATTALGDADNNGLYEEIYVYGARSFSVWNASTGTLVYDSGDELERITANHPIYSNLFNASNGAAIAKKNRSDDKGPEPEGVAISVINGRTYAFVALERIGGVMVFDVTNPAAPQYVTYANNRGPDRGAEGIIVIPAADSPNGNALVILANETSSTLSIFQINPCTANPVYLTETACETYTLNGVTYDESGMYEQDTVTPEGCNQKIYLTLTIYEPVTADAGEDKITCQANSVTMTPTAPTTGGGEWTGGAGVWDGNVYTPDESEFGTTITVTWTVTNGLCQESDDALITISNTPPNAQINATNGGVIDCNNTSVTLTASGGLSYIWDDNSIHPVQTVAAGGEYAVTVTDAAGCTAETNINVSEIPFPEFTLNGTTNTCIGGIIGLIATGGNQYQWSGTNGFSGTSANITRNNANLTMSGTYTVTITNNNCVIVLSKVVTVNALPVATITGANSVCSGGTIALSVPAGAVSYAWTGPGGFTANTAAINRTGATTLMSGNYAVTVTGAGGCTASGVKTVTITAPTTATITGATSFCANSTITLTATTAGVGYNWSGPGGYTQTGATLSRANATAAMAGTYTVTVTTAAGCIATASRTISVSAAPTAAVTNNSNCTRVWLIASGGNSYAWSGPNGYTTTGTTVLRNPATPAMFGAYTVTVTGNGGCTATANVTVLPCGAGKSGEEITTETVTAYPNPSKGLTTLLFTVNADEPVKLLVYNAEGREVAVLFNGFAQANTAYSLPFDMTNLPAGNYYAVLNRANGSSEQLPLLLVK